MDAVRFTIGDIDSDDVLFQDEEIDYMLTKEDNSLTGASALACEVLATRFARKVNRTLDSTITESLSQLSKAYRIQAKELREKQKNNETLFEGVFISPIAVARTRRFTTGQFKNPGSD